MNSKKTILIFIDWFLPAYKAGGPVRSVANIVERLNYKFNFLIVTSDRDLGDNAPYNNIKTDIWLEKKKYKIIYLSPKKQNYKFIKNIIEQTNFDSAYFNSLFSFKFTLLPLFLVRKKKKDAKIILAVRGMLGDSSLEIKNKKKYVFLKVTSFFNFFRRITWHATNNTEIENIKDKISPKSKIILAKNISSKPGVYGAKEITDTIRITNISRIASIKNIHFAIEVLKEVKITKHIIFDIYGPKEDEDYYNKCLKLSKEVPDNINVIFKGTLNHDKVNEVLNKYHFFFFPTLHENFGHVIFEAFSAGLPVIISKNTPWQNLKEKNIGFDIDLSNKNEFIETIEKLSNISQEGYDLMSRKSHEFATKFSSDETITNNTIKLFE